MIWNGLEQGSKSAAKGNLENGNKIESVLRIGMEKETT